MQILIHVPIEITFFRKEAFELIFEIMENIPTTTKIQQEEIQVNDKSFQVTTATTKIKVSTLIERTLHSKFFKVILFLFGGFGIGIYFSHLTPFSKRIFILLSLFLAGYFTYLNAKSILHEVSLLNTVILHRFVEYTNAPWHNEVIPGLYLGAQPMLNLDHHLELPKQLGVDTILTMVELEHELGVGLLTEPVKPDDWRLAGGIQQHVIDTPDFLPVSQQKIHQAVEIIHECIQRGGKIYIHCKAGRGRSATAVVCYLLKYGMQINGEMKFFDDPVHAISYVKTKRSVISLNPKQMQAIVQFHADLKSRRAESSM